MISAVVWVEFYDFIQIEFNYSSDWWIKIGFKKSFLLHFGLVLQLNFWMYSVLYFTYLNIEKKNMNKFAIEVGLQL